MQKKKKHQKKTKKPEINFHRLAKITSRSLSKAYESFKNKQKINKLKKIKLKKREEARGITKEKKKTKIKRRANYKRSRRAKKKKRGTNIKR